MNSNQNIINELFSFDDIVDEFGLLLEKKKLNHQKHLKK